MNDNTLMMVVGGGLALLGSLTVFGHLKGWRNAREDDENDEFERAFLRKRVRRRLQTSMLLIVLGLMIGLHPFVIPDPKEAPQLFGVWWLAALLIAGWTIVMAMADLLSTRAHLQVSRARLQLKQRQLNEQLEEFHRRQRDAGG